MGCEVSRESQDSLGHAQKSSLILSLPYQTMTGFATGDGRANAPIGLAFHERQAQCTHGRHVVTILSVANVWRSDLDTGTYSGPQPPLFPFFLRFHTLVLPAAWPLPLSSPFSGKQDVVYTRWMGPTLNSVSTLFLKY